MKRALLLALALTSVSLSSPSSAARPALFDGVAAVVDDEVILFSHVWARARKYKKSLERAGTPVPQATLEKEITNRLIDDILVAREAKILKIGVEPADVEHALDLVATQNKLSKPDLLKAVVAEGLTEAEYREEVRRQLLEGKWLQIRTIQKRLTDAEAMGKERARLLEEMRNASFVEVRL